MQFPEGILSSSSEAMLAPRRFVYGATGILEDYM
jgi:hypothetical protein